MDQQERAKYQEELEDISEKDIMLEVMAELKAIRTLLQDEERRPNTQLHEPEQEYECQICGATVGEENLEDHLDSEHSVPSVIDVKAEYQAL